MEITPILISYVGRIITRMLIVFILWNCTRDGTSKLTSANRWEYNHHCSAGWLISVRVYGK
jgi:hypothetical protein